MVCINPARRRVVLFAKGGGVAGGQHRQVLRLWFLGSILVKNSMMPLSLIRNGSVGRNRGV